MSASWRLDGVDLEQLDVLASRVALSIKSGDVVTLSGPLGAGKTTFARALVRHLGGKDEVPSPTFAIMQRYETPRLTLSHCDFYRLQPEELDELGLDDAMAEGSLLIEWPERGANWLPSDRLDIALEEVNHHALRRIDLAGHGAWAGRLERMHALTHFLDGTRFADAEAQYLQGDASTRAYARLLGTGGCAILMDAPRQPDGPPIRGGEPYSALVHLAEDVTPYVAVAGALRECGLSAPQIYAFDLDRGFVVLEDFGDRVFAAEVERGTAQRELWTAGVHLLLALAKTPPAETLSIPGHAPYPLPRFDAEAMLIEALLVLDWLWPVLHGVETPESLRREFEDLWSPRLERAAAADPGWVLRDYHSPNLMWLPERDGIRRVGLLDFQDALSGPLAYDLVSLLQDARVDVPEALERDLLDRYCAARNAQSESFQSDDFRTLYATLGAQRNSKILGIFARLAKRDGKCGYLAHIPRVARYLERDLAREGLGDLRAFYAREFPAASDLPPPAL